MSQPLEDFMFDWQCVAESLEAEHEATEEARRKAESGSSQPTMSFEDWQQAAKADMKGKPSRDRGDRS